jgi:hypothetical protein
VRVCVLFSQPPGAASSVPVAAQRSSARLSVLLCVCFLCLRCLSTPIRVCVCKSSHPKLTYKVPVLTSPALHCLNYPYNHNVSGSIDNDIFYWWFSYVIDKTLICYIGLIPFYFVLTLHVTHSLYPHSSYTHTGLVSSSGLIIRPTPAASDSYSDLALLSVKRILDSFRDIQNFGTKVPFPTFFPAPFLSIFLCIFQFYHRI